MKLRAGMTLVTKNGQRYSNAVVYKIAEGEVSVLSDFGNMMKYKSEEDVLLNYDISEGYLEFYQFVGESHTIEELDSFFSVRDRLYHQIELLTTALRGLE